MPARNLKCTEHLNQQPCGMTVQVYTMTMYDMMTRTWNVDVKPSKPRYPIISSRPYKGYMPPTCVDACNGNGGGGGGEQQAIPFYTHACCRVPHSLPGYSCKLVISKFAGIKAEGCMIL